jgi:putative addiction module component (TIGR02574 family)
MPYNKKELMALPTEEKVELMGELWDSLDNITTIPEWKKDLIKERIKSDKADPGNGISWTELRKKYFDK